MAGELRALIGPGAFLRRGRAGTALFVSDFPARALDKTPRLLARLEEAGWEAEIRGGLCRLGLSPEKARAFLASLPDAPPGPGLAAVLRRHGRGFSGADAGELRRALLLWDAGDVPALSRLAGRALAVALREKRAVPAFYAALLCQEDAR